MKGVSPILATVLIVLVAISLSGAFLVFTQSTSTQLTEGAQESQEQLQAELDVRPVIEGVSDSQIFLRNGGTDDITADSITVFIDGTRISHSVTSPVQPNTVGTVTLSDTWKAGLGERTLRITSGSLSDSVRVNVEGPGGNVLDLRLDDASGPNLFSNPGFESGMQGWVQNEPIETVADEVHSGDVAVHSDATSPQAAWVEQSVPVTVGNAYVVSWWVKSTEGEAQVKIDDDTIYDSNRNTFDWRYVSHVFTASSTAVDIQFGNGETGDSGYGDVWYDDVSVVELLSTVAMDSSGNGNSGTLMNGTVWVPGRHANGIILDGPDDYLDISGPGLSSFSEVTIEAWVKPHDISGLHAVLSSSNNGVLLRQSGANVEMRVSTVGNNRDSVKTSSAPLTRGDFSHVIGTFDGTDMTVYVDGSLEASASHSNPGVLNSNTAQEVGSIVAGSQFFNGVIDEVRVYDTAYEPDELYAIGST